LRVRDDGGVEYDQYNFVVAGHTGADLFVCGVRGHAAGVAGGGGDDAGRLPEAALGAPEAAHAENGLLQMCGKGGLQGFAAKMMAVGYWHGSAAAGQCIGGGWYGRFCAEQAH